MVNKQTKQTGHSRKAAGFSWLRVSHMNCRLLVALHLPNSATSSVWSVHFQVAISERVLPAAQGSSDSFGQKGEFIGRKL